MRNAYERTRKLVTSKY